MRSATYTKLNFHISNFDKTGISSTNTTEAVNQRKRTLKEILPQRIYDDYNRMAYGTTALEKILCKITDKSFLYKILTCVAIIGYIPNAFLNRTKMKTYQLRKKHILKTNN